MNGIALARSGWGLGADATVKILTAKIQKRPIRENFNPRKFPGMYVRVSDCILVCTCTCVNVYIIYISVYVYMYIIII